MEQGFLNPNQALDELELSSEMIAVDFGSGSGGWAIPLAKRLRNGKVFAIDVLSEPLSALKSKAKTEEVFNIQTICSDVEKKGGSKLGENQVDLVLMTNLLFQAENKKAIFEEARRILRKGGKVLVVDWLAKTFLGPEKGRVSVSEVKKTAKESGFKPEKEFKAGAQHYGLIFERS